MKTLKSLVKTEVKFSEVYENSDNFTSNVTREDYKINYRLNCDSKCLIYLFIC